MQDVPKTADILLLEPVEEDLARGWAVTGILRFTLLCSHRHT